MENIKDTKKGQKIIAAIHLSTAHMSDTDPLKTELRAQAIDLVLGSSYERDVSAKALLTLLDAAVLARAISEKNASIISLEIRHYSNQESMTLDGVFGDGKQLPSREERPKDRMSFSHDAIQKPSLAPVLKREPVLENKLRRQQKILSFINDRKSAAIKDIAALFPEISEKTIQRELGTLVSQGKITKRGDKRWSIYMAVGA